jgi:pimeloyl-ACP methyl ester carboxylesterase
MCKNIIVTIFFLFTVCGHINSQETPAMSDKNTTVYMLSGLGLDPAIFSRLEIGADAVYHLRWIEPEKGEELKDYAKRMSACIDPIEGRLVLIGHSFGGVLMQEISKIVKTDKIILVSSIKAKKEKTAAMNFWMRIFPVHRLAGQKMILNTFKSWGSHHGYDTQASQKVFRDACVQHSSYYFKWATTEICKWKSEGINTPVVHIHGTSDKTFPHRKIQDPVILVEGGDHIMVFNQAEEVNEIINSVLRE